MGKLFRYIFFPEKWEQKLNGESWNAIKQIRDKRAQNLSMRTNHEAHRERWETKRDPTRKWNGNSKFISLTSKTAPAFTSISI